MITEEFKKTVERDAERLIEYGVKLCTHIASPRPLHADFAIQPVVRLSWDTRRLNSYGGIKDNRIYLDLALHALLESGSLLTGFHYTEHYNEGRAAPSLSNRPYLEVLACLISHELAHASVFYAAMFDSELHNDDDHCPAFQLMYCYLRKNLMFIVAHESVVSLPRWETVAPIVIESTPALKAYIASNLGRSYSDSEGEHDYGVAGLIDLYIEDALLFDSWPLELQDLSTLSVELLHEHYIP